MMKIASSRTLRAMEIAAELRAAGATWQMAADQVGRQLGVLHRWSNHYREDWERFMRLADECLARVTTNESRNLLRAMLRHKNPKIRSITADQLTKHRLEQKAAEQPPEPTASSAAMLACMEQLTQADLERYLANFVRHALANGTLKLDDLTAAANHTVAVGPPAETWALSRDDDSGELRHACYVRRQIVLCLVFRVPCPRLCVGMLESPCPPKAVGMAPSLVFSAVQLRVSVKPSTTQIWCHAMFSTLTRGSFAFAAIAAFVFIGCSKDDAGDLKLVTVKGKLTERGGKAVSGGTLDFRPMDDNLKGAASADVGEDGSFIVRTLLKQKKLDGMAPGQYAVTYLPKSAADQMGDPFEFEGMLTVSDAGFPDTNLLKLEMPARKR